MNAERSDGDRARSIATSLHDQFQSTGGYWVVFAWFLASRRDLFAPEFCDKLSQTAERVEPMSLQQVEEVFHEDFNRPMASIVENVKEAPVWTSMAGQLHEAVLRRTGEPIWLQVQRPSGVLNLQEDMASIEKLCQLLSTGPLRHVPWMRIFAGWRSQLNDSLDLRYLAFSYRNRRRRWKKLSGAHSPKVYRKISTRQVLIMERLPSVSLAWMLETLDKDPDRVRVWLQANQIRVKKLVRRLYETFLSEIIEHNVVPQDMRLEQILVLRSGHFGVMPAPFAPEVRLENDRSRGFRGLARHLPRRSYVNAHNDMVALMEPLPQLDPLTFKKSITREFRAWGQRDAVRTLPPDQRSIGNLFSIIAEVCRKRQVVFEAGSANALDAWHRIERGLLRLDPRLTNMRFLDRFFSRSALRMARAAQKRKRGQSRQSGADLKTRAQAPYDLMDAMERITEFSSGKALEYSNRASKPAYLFAQLFTGLRNLTALVGCLTLITFILQHVYPTSLTQSTIDDLFHFSWLEFLIAGIAEVWLFLVTHRIAVRFGVADSALPGRRSI